MRYFLFYLVLFFSSSLFAQQYDYLWNTVYVLELNGKYQSAADEVNKIYSEAHKDQNKEQLIRAFLYQSKYILLLEEKAQNKVIQNLENEINTTSGIHQSLLNYIYAQSLLKYIQQYRWRLPNNNNADSSINHFDSWTFQVFESKINQAYQASLKDKTLLLNTSISQFPELIQTGTESEISDRSVYDFLVFEYIDFLTEYTYNTRQINDIQALELALKKPEVFIKSVFSDENVVKWICLLQEIESTYLAQNKKIELERSWLKRLNLLEEIRFTSKENYLNAYQLYVDHSKVTYFKSEAQFKQAQLYYSSASKEANPDYNRKALVLLDSILTVRNSSFTYLESEKLRKRITEKKLELSLVENLYENENSRAFIRHKNVDTLYVSVYKNSNSIFFDKYTNSNDSLIKTIISNQIPEKTFKYALQNKKDYFEYTTEVLLPKFEKGDYLLVFGHSTSSKDKQSFKVEYIRFRVSNIYLNYIQHKKTVEFLVLDRKTGKPIPGATVHFDTNSATTDKNGEVIIKSPKTKHGENVTVSVNYNDDHFFTSIYNYSFYHDDEDDEWNVMSTIYTDRSIYRPGQTLYYKGIIYQQKKGKTSVVKDVYVTLEINSNGEVLEEKRIKTNEFGSFSGEFIIPKNILTGDLSISIYEDESPELDKNYNHRKDEHPFWDNIDSFDEEYIIVKIEEYKRPTFEVVFDKEIKDYVINDTITITGKAKSYSGAIISDAKINYVVTRNVHYSRSNFSYNHLNSGTISLGEILTDKNGEFTIKFHAKPDSAVDGKGLPIFNFVINADITDTQGETRSGSKSIQLGYHNLNLFTRLPREVTIDKPLDISVFTQNLNGNPTPTEVRARIYKNSRSDIPYKSRLFSIPEIQTIPRDEFQTLFPYESYTFSNNTDDLELVYEELFHTDNKQKITIDNLEKWSSGNYKLVLSATDSKSGEEITNENSFKINNPKINPYKTLFDFQKLNSDYIKDGEIQYRLLSSHNQSLSILVKAYHKGKEVYKKRIDLDRWSSINIPINKNWDNKLFVEFFFAWENQDFIKTDEINFETNIRALETEIISMKNLIEPGSPQSWSFRIKDQNQKGVHAEVLASMYDLSLDDFYYTPWKVNTSSYYNYYYSNNYTITDYRNISKKNINSLSNYNYHMKKSFKSSFNFYGYNFATKQNDYNYIQFIKNSTKYFKVTDNAQAIKGIVLAEDDGLPLPGATIFNFTRKTYTSTSLDGEFEINASEKDTLIISTLGMNDVKIEVNSSHLNSKNIFFLDYNESHLDEIVVLAYGSQRKESITGSVLMSPENDRLGLNLKGWVSGVNTTGITFSDNVIQFRGTGSLNNSLAPLYIIDGKPLTSNELLEIKGDDITDFKILKDASATALYGSKAVNGVIIITTKNSLKELTNVKTRKNLSEAAFFYPNIRTDKRGGLNFNFNSPEALSSWKLRLLSHTKNMSNSYFEHIVITQKELMIQPNMPRFLRESDTIYIKAKVSNLSQVAQSGMALLELTNISDNKTVAITEPIQYFKPQSKENQTLTWKIVVPKGTTGLEYKITAKAGNFTDGEIGIIPVLPNRIFVTESVPIWMPKNSQKDFAVENLSKSSSTRQNQSFTIEYTSNPTWIAIGSLPYLMEYEHDCSEQIFSKYFANVIASHIVESNPDIKKVLDKWSLNPTSKLEENPEIKSILLSETPWVLDSKFIEEQKKNLSLLMDLQKVKTSSTQIFKRLSEKQKTSGGFGWFEGSPENIYITTHIVSGLGQLKKMGIDSVYINTFEPMAHNALSFLDKKISKNQQKTTNNTLLASSYNDLNYLYARSFYPELKIEDTLQQRINFKLKSYKKNWLNLSLYQKALLSVILYRNADTLMAQKIIEHFKESSVINTQYGMYWLENTSSPYWYKSPVETQALLIEAFNEITPNDTNSIEKMKVWLIKQKQVKNWSTTKSTTLAISALLKGHQNFVSPKNNTSFKIGKQVMKAKTSNTTKTEDEAGYYKFAWTGEQITQDLAQIKIENESEHVGYGGIFWSYFEELENISSSGSNLMNISKELYLKKQAIGKNEVEKISPNTKLKLGDLITIRLTITCSEDIDFVHLKDVRASGFEPVDVVSVYEYQNGLYYYKSTKDVATHFFFDLLHKGTYVLEYDVRVNNLGNFSNGITTIQSMYAPEYSSHTSSIRISTEE